MSQFASHDEVLNHLKGRGRFLDVRAPVEFVAGSLPNAVNIPILTDEERHLIGIEYKQSGQDAAIHLGNTLVSGATKQSRVKAWIEACANDGDILLYCFRGGMRSAYAQSWLTEAGVPIKRIQGGYKYYRNVLSDILEARSHKMNAIILSGRTGSGKTEMLKDLPRSVPMVDLEGLANHRGSAFGNRLQPQPSQVDFENRLAVELMRLEDCDRPLVIEDESRTIGSIVIPASFFEKMKSSPVVVIDDPVEERACRIFREYVQGAYSELSKNAHPKLDLIEKLLTPLMKIEKRLGGLRTHQAKEMLVSAFQTSDFLDFELHRDWIVFLLVHYYDPLYEKGIERKSDRIRFRGTREQVMNYLKVDSNHIATV
jgi:tRNA 2-selenouridine synthase